MKKTLFKMKTNKIYNENRLCKNNVISSCDCLLGFLSGEKVNKSTIDYEVKRLVNIQPTFKKYGLLNGEPQSKSQIVDGRKGYLSRFVYCPYCGEKVNWKQVLSNCL
jgi:hypothetical protein